MKLQGQNLRILVGNKCIACSTDCTINVNVDMEESPCKDDVDNGIWKKSDVIAKGWSVDVNSLYDPDATDTDAMTSAQLVAKIIAGKTTEELTVHLAMDITEGPQNRGPKGSALAYEGDAIYSSLSIGAAARQKTTFGHSFAGNGALAETAK